ncbi:FxSxx-COOH system tetratricopeptide repeat protein [Streptomyces sp. NPDC001068]|uniref:FxSxx-COOH system tetratricopeptide repeat protein n=1 Tax=Streptomyces sp. NPDC001068 TaxID=3364544 RepID=UPI0036C10461
MRTNDVDTDEVPLLIEPVVAWPRQAETDCDYLVTVDLRGPLRDGTATEPDWPWQEEEFTFTVTLEGARLFACAALDEPAVVLHRFGGTYGPARFAVSTGNEPGTASLWLTISNQWGVPVRKAELRSEIGEREPGGPPAARPAPDQPVITTVATAPPADRGRRGFRGALSRLLVGSGPDEPPEAGSRAEASPPPRRDGLAQSAVRDERETITISFAGFNRAWAAWIGDRLERCGVRVVHLRWDAPAEVPLVHLLRDLTLAQGRVLIIVSDRYFRLGSRTHEEWNAALREVVAPDPSRFVAVSITEAAVPSGIAVLAAVDLTRMNADEAERRLLDRMELPSDLLPEPRGGPRGPRFPLAAPEVWGGVPRRNTRFTGREQLLNDAYTLLQSSEPDAGVLTLHGMSGVGKTQLAAEYVYRFGSEYDVVWWVNAEKRVTYRRLLAELAPRLGLSTGEEYGERLRAVREALRRGEPYSRWLLVLDGADDPDQIGDLIPTGPGHVIITSRNPEWADHHSRLLDVPVYDRDESVAFIRLRAPRLTGADADQLAEALEDLPLLLDQTAGWLDDSELSVADYIALLDSGLDQDVVKVSMDFPVTFRTAWSILLNKLRDTVPESVDLLRLCTFFAPGFIPLRLLRETPRDGLPDQLAGLLGDPLLWARAINQLRQYSVVRLESYEQTPDDAPSTGDSLYLHRMVHRIVHQDMTPEELRFYGDVVRGALAEADPGRPSDSRDWSAYAEIVPHLRYADTLRSTDPGVQTLLLNSLRYLLFIGEYAEGIELGRRTVEHWQASLGESHPQIWELIYHYANLLRADGHYAQTEAIERAAVQRLREERGLNDVDHLRMASGLAADLRGLGRYEEALELSRSLHTAYRDLLGEEDSRTLNALNNLGFSLRQLGRYGQALEIDRQTLDARRRILSRRHVFTLFSEVSYAVDLRLMGRYAEAETIQTMNVREHGSVLGPDNPQTLRAAHNLALCHHRSGDHTRAHSLLTRVLERYDRKLGETHLETLGAAVSQSCFVREHGDIDRAREASEILVARYEHLLPVGHPFITGVRANHALLLNASGERENARALTEQSLADMTTEVGEQHPYTLGCAINAAALRNSGGDTESAAELSRLTVARATQTLGPTHPLTLSARTALADDLRSLGNRQQADRIEQEALADLAATLGPQHPHTLSARSRTRPHWDFEPQTT